MNGTADADDIYRFRDLLGRRMGLQFDEAKRGFLGEVLQRRLGQYGDTTQAYLCGLDAGADRAELGELARLVTVGETYFFRNAEQFRALAEEAVPDRLRANAARRSLRLLSAGCASGEEAYSLAMILGEAGILGAAGSDPAWDVSIRAVDINPAALEKAARGRYSPWALRETSATAQAKWFQAAGREMILDPAVRSAVCFDQRNLASDDDELWRLDSLDIVFCRNVIMYFAPEPARALVRRIATALRPGGYLFLGHAETLRGLSEDFHLRHTHDTFYYQRKRAAGDESDGPRPETAAEAGMAAPADGSWIDVIRGASERVAALAAGPAAAERRPGAPTGDLAAAFNLLGRERFAEALAAVQTLPAERRRHPDILLLEAMLLAHARRVPAAEEACRRLLAIDDLNAGAHYIAALCRESAGDPAGAAEHDHVASYLDPNFAMPRLHLGLLARRAGDPAAARREFTAALALLRREDSARVLLFGGGFDRNALTALCRSALKGCGGR